MDQIINRATVCKICYNPREIRAAAVEMNKSFKYEARFFFLSFMDETSARESGYTCKKVGNSRLFHWIVLTNGAIGNALLLSRNAMNTASS